MAEDLDFRLEKPDKKEAGSTNSVLETFLKEVGNGIADFTREMKERAKGDVDPSAESGLSKLSITGTDSDKSTAKFDSLGDSQKGQTIEILGGPGDKIDEEARAFAARRYETRATLALDRAHSTLTFTTDGSAPAEIQPKDSHAISSDQSPEQIARAVLGSKATADQVTTYVDAVYELNGRLIASDASGNDIFPAGSTIRLPGQAKDGAIFYRGDSGSLMRGWNDGTSLEQRSDGTKVAKYRDGNTSVETSWNPKVISANGEARSSYVTTGSGAAAGGYFQETLRTTDGEGRTIEKELKDGKVQSVKITDKHSNVIELAPTRDGQFRGQKTNRGTVVESDMWMTEKGRVYTRSTSKLGDVTRTYEDGAKEIYDARGRLKARDWEDSKGRAVHESYKPGKNFPDQVKFTDKDGSVTELRLGKDGEFHGTRKDASGNVVDADVGMPGDGRVQIFSRKKEADGSLTKAFEDGFVERLDAQGNRLHTEGTDSAGRKFSADFNPGEPTPFKYALEVKAGDAPVEFNRTANNRYVADHVDASGNKVGTVELLPNQALRYEDRSAGRAWVTHPDGRTVRAENLPSGLRKLTETKNVETHSITLDSQGRKVEEVFATPMRTMKIQTTFDASGKANHKVTMRDYKGTTELAHDSATDTFKGTRSIFFQDDETVSFDGNKLVYRDADGKITQVEKFQKQEGSLVPSFVDVEYDADGGTVSRPLGSNFSLKESYSPGRTDFVMQNGFTNGFTTTGEMSWAGAKGTNDAAVIHPDGTGAHMRNDGTIVVWDRQSGTRTENLSSVEKDFLKDNPDIDRRDVAEAHRRLSPDQTRIDKFFESLKKIDGAANLSQAERVDLKQNLLHHVAYPAEIYQGRSPTCNVSVVQREMAINSPEQYASFVIDAVSKGKAITADGTEVHFNQDNLKMSDSSGRDLASRIFQSAAVNVLLYPRGEAFLNTESGVGEVRAIRGESDAWFWSDEEYAFRYNSSSKTFQGLLIDDIATVTSRLTGDNRGGVYVDSAEELVALYKSNGEKPMTIAVNGGQYPFDKSGPIGTDAGGANHVVTIVGVDNGPPAKFLVQNQWGLGSDHSTATRAIDADDLIFNMSSGGLRAAYVLARVPSGDPSQFYSMEVKADGTVDLKQECKLQRVSDTTAVCR